MTLLAAEPSAIFTEFSRRAAELGVLCWSCEVDGTIREQMPDDGLASRLLRSEEFRFAVEAVAGASDGSDVAERFPGCRFLRQNDRGEIAVALVVTPDAWEAPDFARVFGQADMDVRRAKQVFAPFIQPGKIQANRTIAALRHYHSDLCTSAGDRRLSEQFTRQLSQFYEEMNVLFRMARSLNSSNDAVVVTKRVCDELSQVLPFRWMAIWFVDGEHVVPELAGRLTSTGALPCGAEVLVEHAQKLCGQAPSEPWTQILLRGKNDLATLAGSEILAEAISRGKRNVGVLLAGNKQGEDQDVSSEETQFLDAAANFISVFHENMARFAELRSQFLCTLRALSAAIDAKDPYTCGHSDRVAILASKLAAALKLDRAEVETYRIAGLLHDVGKIGVPEAALCKEGRLTEDEFAQIKRHPEIGFKILRGIPATEQILPGVLHHHERWDGRGYPHGLAGEKIPLIGRCLALADTFDAMSSSRSYRKAMGRDVVLAEIKRSAGSQFDPKLVEVFLTLDFSDFSAS